MEQRDARSLPDMVSPDTRFVRSGIPDTVSMAGVPTTLPIYTSTTYRYPDMARLDQANTFRSSQQDYVYAQCGNPNTDAVEQALAEIEKGAGALMTGSGMNAIYIALLASGPKYGKKLLVSQALYGTSLELFQSILAAQGVEIILRDFCLPTAQLHQMLLHEQPDIIYVESLSNPLLKLIDIQAVCVIAHQIGCITIVDNTFATPYLLRPLTYGCDIVVHSATKYLGGHGDSSAGILVSRDQTLLERARHYALLMGTTPGPFEAYLILRGLRTLPLRMERHCQNALRVASFLAQHPAVARVHYPGLSDHPQHFLANRLLKQGFYGGIVPFELRQQSREAVFHFMNRLRLFLPITTLGDVYSEVCYPPLSSHRNLSEMQCEALGITAGCIRLSVGIENQEDILCDLEQALD